MEHIADISEFRTNCINAIKNIGYMNKGNLFERYLAGDNFDVAQLEHMGYDYVEALHISAHINNVQNICNYLQYSRSRTSTLIWD